MAGATNLLGHSMGRYLIQSVIGSGGFATVYRAVDTALERTVALKVVDPAAHRNPTIGRRFLLEGRAVASLSHPAVVPVYDTGEDDGVLWLAMRLVEGSSLDQTIATGRGFSPDHTTALMGRIGAALDHAHAHGVVHRDVKPSNILLEDDDPRRAWLADFGIAATARTAGLYTTGALGTAAYMAPEQSRPSEVGPAADLYSLACVAYEMLARRRPFPGDDYVALLLAHATAPVPPIGHPGLDALMVRALAKDPAARPVSGAALVGELRDALATDETAVIPQGQPATRQTHGMPGAQLPPRLLAASSVPTVVDNSDDTLVYPVAPPSPVPSPPVHGPAPVRGAPPPPVPTPPAQPAPGRGAPPVRRPAAPGRRLPAPPPPGRDPTVVRNSRRGTRRFLAAGLVILLVGGAAAAVALRERERANRPVLITDSAGASYEVPRSWTPQDEPNLVTWRRDGAVVAAVSHQPLENPDDRDAVDLLDDYRPAVCLDVAPAAMAFDGADAGAVCQNPPNSDLALAAAVVVGGELWVVTVQGSVPEEQRNRLLNSLRFS